MAKKTRSTTCAATKRRSAKASSADPPRTASTEADEPPKAAKPVKRKRAAKTSKSGAKATRLRVDAAHTRLKAYWAVCNQTMTIVSLFEYGDKNAADHLAEELTESKKSLHFVQVVKRAVEE